MANSLLKKEKTKTTNPINLKIESIVKSNIENDIDNKEEIYNEQVIEDWYDFASNIESIIEQNGNIKFISENKQALSQHINFYINDNEGNKTNGMIDLRLLDHKLISNDRELSKIENLNDLDHGLVFVAVNGDVFNNYEETLIYIKELLNKM